MFYSTYGHIYKLAQAVAEGARSVEGVTVRLARIPETLSDEILGKMKALEARVCLLHLHLRLKHVFSHATSCWWFAEHRSSGRTSQR